MSGCGTVLRRVRLTGPRARDDADEMAGTGTAGQWPHVLHGSEAFVDAGVPHQGVRAPMKILVVIALLLIVGSLGSALFFLMRDKGNSNRTVHALAVRVSISVLLFVLLLLGYFAGWIKPTGVMY